MPVPDDVGLVKRVVEACGWRADGELEGGLVLMGGRVMQGGT
jgi:hypothetical protein